MGKKLRFKTISLGSDPDIPSADELSSLISNAKGSEADLTTFQMLRSGKFQYDVDLDESGVGGEYSTPRMNKALLWDSDNGLIIDTSEIVSDYSMITRKGGFIRSVHESPGVLGCSPDINDEDGFAEFCKGYGIILRSLRDTGMKGHVILTKKPDLLELELISNMKNIIYLMEPEERELEELLEFTTKLVIHSQFISVIPNLMDSYKVRDLVIVDPHSEDLVAVLEFIDRDHVIVAGYALGDEKSYWERLKSSAEVTL
jgi:hypothetical protein